MAPEIATGYDKLAINLEQHIRFYEPSGWIVPISNVAHTPMFSADEARVFMDAHKGAQLKPRLEELGNSDDFPPSKVKPWYVKEAIEDFFSRELYSQYESEL